MVHNEADLEWNEVEHGDARFRRKKLGAGTDAERLGCSLYEIPPGAHAWPYHYHAGNEEALYVLSGEGRLRGPDGEEAIAAGDYAAFPEGPEGAHSVANDGEETLRFLVLSTMTDPDVTVYPDSETLGVYTGTAPGGDETDRPVHGYFREDDAVDFWSVVADEE